MGRGRQRAKHTKVARELKYYSPDTNYSELERELAADHSSEEDRWEELASKYDVDYDEEEDDEK